MIDVLRGDIYYVEDLGNKKGHEVQGSRPAVIVSNDTANHFSTVIEVVYLTTTEKKPLPTHVKIMSSDMKSTALCEQIDSVSKERLTSYVNSCTKDEMQQIDRALLVSLGLYEQELENHESEAEKAELKTYIKELEEKIKVFQTAHDATGAIIKEQNTEIFRITTERDVFKNLYAETLEKMIHQKEG